MENRIQIAPSILSADFTKLADDIHLMETAGADMLHVDVMDGHFVPNITFGPMIVEAINRITKQFLDVHLMIQDPAKYAEAFIKAGADRLLVHIEVLKDPKPLLDQIRAQGCQAGLVLNPETPFEQVEPHLGSIDCLLVMSVHPGFGGQKFIPEVLSKAQRAKAMREMNGWSWPIEIDGGIDAETAPQAVQSGVQILVAGNAILKAKDPTQALKQIRQSAELAAQESGSTRAQSRPDEGFL